MENSLIIKSKIYLLPNFVDVNLFKRLEVEKERNLLVFVGRLHHEKNLQMLLEVMRGLPQYKLWIVGEGPLHQELIDIKERDELENVEFLGLVPNEKLPGYLNKAEAFIMVSHMEGHPKAMIAAMSCELPCIGTNVDGIKEIIIDSKAGLVCNKHPEDIRKCILESFRDRERMGKMGRNARKFVVENYSANSIIEKRVKLIKGELSSLRPL